MRDVGGYGGVGKLDRGRGRGRPSERGVGRGGTPRGMGAVTDCLGAGGRGRHWGTGMTRSSHSASLAPIVGRRRKLRRHPIHSGAPSSSTTGIGRVAAHRPGTRAKDGDRPGEKGPTGWVWTKRDTYRSDSSWYRPLPSLYRVCPRLRPSDLRN